MRCGNGGRGGALHHPSHFQPLLLHRDIWSRSEPSRGCPEPTAILRSPRDPSHKRDHLGCITLLPPHHHPRQAEVPGEGVESAGWAPWHILLYGQTHPSYSQPGTRQCTAIKRAQKPSSLCFSEGSTAPLQAQEPSASLPASPHPSLHQQGPVHISCVRGCSSVNLSLEQADCHRV